MTVQNVQGFKHTMTFFPLGNADCCVIKANDAQAYIVWDYGNVGCSDDENDGRIDLAATLQKDLKSLGRDSVDVTVFTHLDRDHVHRSSEFFHFEHAAMYQGDGRIKIDEMWVPAAAIIESGSDGDARVIRQEARFRLKAGRGIKVFSRPGLLDKWLTNEGLSLEERLDCIADAGQFVTNPKLQANGLEVFVHSPFASRQDENGVTDRNNDAIAAQLCFSTGLGTTRALMLSDLDHTALDWMVKVTRHHENNHRLEWDILKVAHHGSYLSLAPNRNEIVSGSISDNLAWLYDVAGDRGTGIISCRRLKDAESDAGGNPPHREAVDFYEGCLDKVRGELLMTMEFPNTREPKPIVIEIGVNGHTVRKLIASGINSITSTSPPRAGGKS